MKYLLYITVSDQSATITADRKVMLNGVEAETTEDLAEAMKIIAQGFPDFTNLKTN